jgi:hypothetical protein
MAEVRNGQHGGLYGSKERIHPLEECFHRRGFVDPTGREGAKGLEGGRDIELDGAFIDVGLAAAVAASQSVGEPLPEEPHACMGTIAAATSASSPAAATLERSTLWGWQDAVPFTVGTTTTTTTTAAFALLTRCKRQLLRRRRDAKGEGKKTLVPPVGFHGKVRPGEKLVGERGDEGGKVRRRLPRRPARRRGVARFENPRAVEAETVPGKGLLD